MRKQPAKPQTGKKAKGFIIASAAVLVLLLGGGIALLSAYHPPYAPPASEATAVNGVPEPDSALNYGKIAAEGGFSFALAGTMYQQKDGSILIYFTNPQDSGVLMMCEIFEEGAGRVLYKSGLISPGQYVERLYPKCEFKNEAMKIEMKVYGFEPETYYSKGTVTLSNTLQPW